MIASPNVSLEALFNILIIDAYEERYVAIVDMSGEYLHANILEAKTILLKVWGCFVNIMCDINPEHKANVRYKRCQKVLYIHVLRAIYGCVESTLHWYTLYIDTLQKKGYVINPYAFCVSSKIIEGKQYTIVWFVDDNKAYHVKPKIIDKLISDLKLHFRDLVITRGKKHSFLGMNIVITNEKKIEIDMEKNLSKL